MAYLDKNHYFFKSILRNDPRAALKFSTDIQKQWNEQFSKDSDLDELMKKWKKSKAVHLVWVSNKFGSTLPADVEEARTHRLLSDIYDAELSTISPQSIDSSDSGELVSDSDAENDRASERQLKQHLRALLLLIKAADTRELLSEELIKNAHKLLAKDLQSDGTDIHAGEYREHSVYCDDHNFIDFERIPVSMKHIIAQYNEKTKTEHDSFHLAGWLLQEMLQIHPFEDGNGRVSRLLWCYSLMRDGLPFPVIPSIGTKKAYKQYISCIKRDTECLGSPSYKHMASLTLVSVTKTWKNFITNLRVECRERCHGTIITWLESTSNLLQSNDSDTEQEP